MYGMWFASAYKLGYQAIILSVVFFALAGIVLWVNWGDAIADTKERQALEEKRNKK